MSQNKASNLGTGSSKGAPSVPGDSDLDRAVAKFLMQSGLRQDQGTLRLSGASGSDLPSANSALPPQTSAAQPITSPFSDAPGALTVNSPASSPLSKPEAAASAADTPLKSQGGNRQQASDTPSHPTPKRDTSRSNLLPDSQLDMERAGYTAISIRNFGSGKPIPRYAKPLSRQASSTGRQSSGGGNAPQLPKARRSSTLMGNM